MIVFYLRSSSYNDFDFCQHKYFFKYVLGWQELTNKAATKGTVVHKAIELMAKQKIHNDYHDSETDFHITGKTEKEEVLLAAFNYYRKKENHLSFNTDDLKECKKWFQHVLDDKDYSPLHRDIFTTEQFFDIEIKEPWAHYSSVIKGEKYEGNLRIRGTVDMIYNLEGKEKGIEYVDWKTGQRKNWATGKKKYLTDFYHDPQLMIYHYALRHTYPDIDLMVFTVYYVKDGGPYTIALDRDDLQISTDMIRDRFETIKQTQTPETIWGDYKCFKMCGFGQNHFPGTNQSICQFIHQKIKKHGIQKVTDYYINLPTIHDYSGGGKTIAGEKDEGKSSGG